MSRPAHADPTLWDWPSVFGVGFTGWRDRPNPVAHKLSADGHRARCYGGWVNRVPAWMDHQCVAQFAVPCLRCWPDAREGRETTVTRRAHAAEELEHLEAVRIRCYDPESGEDPYRDLLAAVEDYLALMKDPS